MANPFNFGVPPSGGIPFLQALQGAASPPAAQQAQPAQDEIPPEAQALLDYIAAPESGGRFNVRYTPKGGVTFDDFSKHPRIFERRKDGRLSSAAGAYQITATTYDRMGGGDFGPESQKRMAWKLAQSDYHARTGRDLLGDLRSEGISENVRKNLQDTWEGLQNLGPTRNRATAVAMAKAKPYEMGDQAPSPGNPQAGYQAMPAQQPGQKAPPTATAPQGLARSSTTVDYTQTYADLPEPLKIELAQAPDVQQTVAAFTSSGGDLKTLRGKSRVARMMALAEYGRALRGEPEPEEA